MFLKVSPIKCIVRFRQRRGKLSPHYIEPFELLECVGKVAYRLALSPRLSEVHNIFYINMLRKYIHANIHVIQFDDIEVGDNATY